MQPLPSMCKSRTVTVRVQEGTALLSTNFVLKQPSRTTAPLNLLRLHHATRMIKLQCCDKLCSMGYFSRGITGALLAWTARAQLYRTCICDAR